MEDWRGHHAERSQRAARRPLHRSGKTARRHDAADTRLARDLGRHTRRAEELRGKVVLHTSGALDARVLDPVKACGAAVGAIHPLQSFSGVTVPSLEARMFAVEGDAQAVSVARQIARSIGGSPVKIPNGKKVLYHAAATMAAANVLAVEEAASQLLMSLGMKRSQATRALLTLTRQVLENMEHLGPRAAWTGPLSRGDYRVLEAHLEALQDFPEEFAQAHELLNRLAARLLSQDVDGMLAELKKITAAKKSKVMGGNA
jgi:predicted short-subunit dehydrogenase-like oxidoreductase (DUF2520 family)